MEFGRPGLEPRLDEVLLLILRPQEVRPGLGGVPEHTAGAGWAPGQLWEWVVYPQAEGSIPVRSSDWDKTRDTGVDRGWGVGCLDDEGLAGVGGPERRGTGRPTWP